MKEGEHFGYLLKCDFVEHIVGTVMATGLWLISACRSHYCTAITLAVSIGEEEGCRVTAQWKPHLTSQSCDPLHRTPQMPVLS